MIDRTIPLPVPVEAALKFLQKDRANDKYRDWQYERLTNAYDGWLFDLNKGIGNQTNSLIDIQDPEAPDDRYHEISVNLAFPLVEDWKSVIGIQPSVYVPSVSPGDPTEDAKANLRERIINAIDSDSGMEIKSLEGAHFQTLFGAQVQYLIPDMTMRRIRKQVVSGYRCHARLALDGINLHHLAFDVETDTELILEEYPDLAPFIRDEESGEYPATVTVTDWWDTRYRIMTVDNKWMEGMPIIDHGWGFVPGVIIPNIVGTGSLWSRSDIRQIIHIAQVLSESVSMSHDALFQNVHDQILAFADKPINQFAVGPYEITQFEKDAKVQLLHQGLNLPDISNSVASLERFARLVGGWPLVMSSEMDSSVISGKAYQAAQGPVGARAAIKHLVMAAYQQRLNAMAMWLYEKMFGNEEITIPLVTGGFHTSEFRTGAQKGQNSLVSFIPRRDIGGEYANFLTFPASGSEAYRDSIKWLQYKEAGIISEDFIRENTPGIDPEAERIRVDRNAMAKAQQAAQMQAMMQPQAPTQAGPTPPAAPAQPSAPENPPAPAGTAPPRGGPAGPSPVGPAESPVATSMPQRGAPIKLSEAKKVFMAIDRIKGVVLLGGAIASTGTTTGEITVYISEPQDKGTIINGTPYGRQGRLLFHKLQVDSEGKPVPPEEQTVNVTPRKSVNTEVA